MGAGTLRHHFVDIPALLGYLIRDHLRAIQAILAQVPGDTPDRPRQRRAAYLEFTRTPLGAYTDMHALMLNNLPILPDDVRVPLIDHRNQVATALAPPDQAGFVLSMIDNPLITPSRLEAAIGTRQDTRPAADEALPPPRERIGEPTDGDIRRPRLPSGARPSATTTREAIVLEFTGRPRTRPH
jgi:AcrR family transcriptional regulator